MWVRFSNERGEFFDEILPLFLCKTVNWFWTIGVFSGQCILEVGMAYHAV